MHYGYIIFKSMVFKMAIRKKDYEIIKTFIHMSIVPMSVKKLWFRDKKFKEWYDREGQISSSK